jgi:UDP-GlcNAc:undecaprenyl-phosphate GlcNAc-1-phosphate transferase
MVPVCVLGIPIFDTSLIFVSRLRRGVNPFTTAGKDHLSHRLVALGMTKLEAVLTCYLLAGICGMVGTYLTRARLEEAYVVVGTMAVVGLVGVTWMEYQCPGGQARTPPAPRT